MVDDKTIYIEGIYENCKIKKGKGNTNADIMMIYEGPEFKSSRRLEQIAKEAKISASFYATPLKKGFSKDTSEIDVMNCIKAEIATVSPKVVWLIGNFPMKVLKLGIPITESYGLYFPLFLDDFFAFPVPTAKMITKMPMIVKKEFYKRMRLFSKEYKSGVKFDSNRRADQKFMKKFNEKHEFKFDKMLSGPKTYYMMFSNTAESHIFILPTEQAKKFFEKKVPFGLKFTQEEVKQMDPKMIEHVAMVMKETGGELIDVDLNAIRRHLDV